MGLTMILNTASHEGCQCPHWALVFTSLAGKPWQEPKVMAIDIRRIQYGILWCPVNALASIIQRHGLENLSRSDYQWSFIDSKIREIPDILYKGGRHETYSNATVLHMSLV